jgi:hypothetical protein
MSKFLLNLLLQISKALVYSKIKFYSEKNFSFTFGPSGLSAHFSPLPSPLGLSLSADPSHPLGPANCTSVAPYRITTSHTGKRLTSRRLRPSLCLADRWAPLVITFLRRRPSSTSRRHLIEPPWLLCPPLHPFSLWMTITTP